MKDTERVPREHTCLIERRRAMKGIERVPRKRSLRERWEQGYVLKESQGSITV
jgi:hypothetical protein